jgi:RES domain-containing protein
MRFLLLTLALPARIRLRRPGGSRPPRSLDASQDVGRAWLDEGATLALVVPSVIVPQEANYVLNAAHSLFARVRVANAEPFSFDERLWRSRRA